jgi:hypothetical protein
MAANPITDYDRRIVREMWTADYSVDQIKAKINRARGTIQYIAASLRLGPKPGSPLVTVWTPDIMADLEVEWFAGATASGVARVLNKKYGTSFTRNATIGKIHRMGLIRSSEVSDLNKRENAMRSPTIRHATNDNRKVEKEKKTKRDKPKPKRTAIPNPAASFAADGNVREAWVIVTDAAWDVLPGTEPKTLFNRRNFGECKYPVGMNEPEQRFCCAKTDQTYCDAHRKIMYRPPSSSDRDALRLRGLLKATAR